MAFSIASIGRAALDFIYPPHCGICNRQGEFLCDACRERLPPADGLRCRVCWLPLKSAQCSACDQQQPAFRALRSVYRYTDEVRPLVYAFKYGGQSSLAPRLGALMRETFEDSGFAVDLIVPVAMTTTRLRSRGYNQASLLAHELARLVDLPASDALRRLRHDSQQARSLSAGQRRLNVEGAFVAARPRDVAARDILLVDDIATTCATLNACAQALLDAGAADVFALTLARED